MLNVAMTLSKTKLTGTRWAFGPRDGPHVTNRVAFRDNGLISGLPGYESAAWKEEDGKLAILAANGTPLWRSSLLYVREDGGVQIILSSVAKLEPDMVVSECTAGGRPGYGGRGALSDADFLFPKDLRVSPDGIEKVLLIGSCLTSLYYNVFSSELPEVGFDYMQFNYASQLPASPPSPLVDYNFQYVQLPLRSMLTDRIVFATQMNDPAYVAEVLSDGFSTIDVMLDAALTYNRSHGLLTFVSNFLVPQGNVAPSVADRYSRHDLTSIVRSLNDYLSNAIRKYTNVFLCDTDSVANSMGKRFCLDDVTGFYSHGTPLHQDAVDRRPGTRIEPVPPMDTFYENKGHDFLMVVWEQIVATYRTVRQIDQVKAVIFDLDNTLWRGQIAEDYRVDSDTRPPGGGWQPGLWEAIHYLRARGILIAICSKNDIDLVEKNWDSVIDPPFLKLKNFTSIKINWNLKSENIQEICHEFNITAKSALFVDDNPVEREAVRTALPGIRVIGSNPYLTRRILLWSAETQVANLSTESKRREDSIRSGLVRETARASLSRAEFLGALNCRMAFIPITHPQQSEFTRAIELTNKSNQFNTTGRRWSYAETLDFLAGGGEIIAFRVVDKFADYGLVGVIYVRDENIIQFIMSCRVMGMEVEQFALSHIADRMRGKLGNTKIRAVWQKTDDNSPCKLIFELSGFREISRDGDTQVFELAESEKPRIPQHIQVLTHVMPQDRSSAPAI